jgi:ABC-type Fe3+ transport system permease subunit
VGDVTIVSQVDVWTLLRGPARGDLLRSLWSSLAAALLVLLVAAGPARTLARGASRLGFWVLVLVPLAVPSLLLGMAQVWLFHRPWPGFDALYSGGGLVVLTYVARYAPLGVLGLRAAWVRLDPEIEEASALLVRRRARRVLQGLLPLLLPGIVATVVVCFGLAMRDLDCIVLLDGAQQTLPLRLYNKVHYARDAEVAALCLLQLCAIFVPVLVVRILAPRSFSLERSTSSL